jgi:pheromone shutdown protein TraB
MNFTGERYELLFNEKDQYMAHKLVGLEKNVDAQEFISNRNDYR